MTVTGQILRVDLYFAARGRAPNLPAFDEDESVWRWEEEKH